MKEAVRPIFDLGQTWTDGRTLREHLLSAEEQTGRTPDRLITPPIPYCFERHMQIWLDLHEWRFVGGGIGLTPLSWLDLDAFCRSTGEVLTREDRRIVRIIEDAFFDARLAAQERRDKEAERKRANAERTARPGKPPRLPPPRRR